MDERSEIRIDELVFKALEETISEQERKELEDIIELNPQAIEYYCSCIEFNIGMVKIKGTMDGPLQMTMALENMAEYEQIAPVVDIPEVKSERQLITKIEHSKASRKISKTSMLSLIMSVAAILFLILYVRFVPIHISPPVATLTDSIETKWFDTSILLENGDRFAANELMSLSKGIIQLQTDQGVHLTIEGPAEFEFTKEANLLLNFGRAYARVSKQGIGFTVNTSNSKVIDLGTEFGVQADIDGKTELHVTKGEIRLVSGSSWLDKMSESVLQDQARRISADGSQVKIIPIQHELFARSVNSEINSIWRGQDFLDLADIIERGNGFGTGNRQNMLDPQTGQYRQKWVSRENYKPEDNINFHVVPENTFVDSVFIPNGGSNQQVQISTTGLIYADCPPTNNRYNDFIQTSENPGKRKLFYSDSPSDLATKPIIYMHTNLGITFDLNEIRSVYPDIQLDAFRTACSITSKPDEKLLTQNKTYRSEFHVLVDGKKLAGVLVATGDVPKRIDDIKLNPTDRFLTLIVTDGGDSTWGDRTFFIRPEIRIK